MKTAIIASESSEKHITGDGHPEQPKRVVSIIDTLKKNKGLLWDKPDVVPNDILNMTHSEDYINNLNNSFPKSGLNFLDGDTVVSPGSKDAVFQAAGSAISAIDGIESKKYKMHFVLYDRQDTMLKKINQWAFAAFLMQVLQLII